MAVPYRLKIVLSIFFYATCGRRTIIDYHPVLYVSCPWGVVMLWWSILLRGSLLTTLSYLRCYLFTVEHFFHIGPPFALFSCWDWNLAGHADRPPFLSGWVRCHFCHIGFEIVAGIFEIAEQVIFTFFQFAEINRIVADVTLLYHFQHGGPDVCVQLLIFFNLLRFYPEDVTVAFYLLLGPRFAGTLRAAGGHKAKGQRCYRNCNKSKLSGISHCDVLLSTLRTILVDSKAGEYML